MRRVILLVTLLFVIASFFVLGLALRMPSARPSAMSDPKADLATPPAVEQTLERLREQQDASLSQIADLRSTISRLQGDLQKDSSATAPGPGGAVGLESLLVLGGGVFEHAGIEPARPAHGAIDKVMGVIHSRPDDGILVEGHSDSSSTTSQNHNKKYSAAVFEANKRISLLRAQAVARMLESKGISADRIVIRGYGDTRPLASNATAEGRSQNRRAGTSRKDTLRGTRGRDVILGLGGNDTIRGLAGNDTICGGTGRDTLIGGDGKDRLLGEDGDDKLFGDKGRDRLDGGSGRDACRTGETARQCEGKPASSKPTSGERPKDPPKPPCPPVSNFPCS